MQNLREFAAKHQGHVGRLWAEVQELVSDLEVVQGKYYRAKDAYERACIDASRCVFDIALRAMAHDGHVCVAESLVVPHSQSHLLLFGFAGPFVPDCLTSETRLEKVLSLPRLRLLGRLRLLPGFFLRQLENVDGGKTMERCRRREKRYT